MNHRGEERGATKHPGLTGGVQDGGGDFTLFIVLIHDLRRRKEKLTCPANLPSNWWVEFDKIFTEETKRCTCFSCGVKTQINHCVLIKDPKEAAWNQMIAQPDVFMFKPHAGHYKKYVNYKMTALVMWRLKIYLWQIKASNQTNKCAI